MTELQVDEFFEHHGVKGMRWGVRKQEDGSPRTPMSAEKKKKIIIGAAVGTALVGVAATAVILKSNGKLPVSNVLKATKSSSSAKTAALGKQRVKFMQEANTLRTQMQEFDAMLKMSNNELYKGMVNNAARAGVPTISRQEFDDIRG